MSKKIIAASAACALACALAGCTSEAVVYDTPTPTGDETTWLDYSQETISYASLAEAQDAGALDVLSLAQAAWDEELNKSRVNTHVSIEDGSWLDGTKLVEGTFVYHDVTSDDDQPIELYYVPNEYFKVEFVVDGAASAKDVADSFIKAAGLTDQMGYNTDDGYLGDLTNYDSDHYLAVGKCTIDGRDGYWYVRVIDGFARCYVVPLGSSFVVSGDVQEYDTQVDTYDSLKENLTRLSGNWVFE